MNYDQYLETRHWRRVRKKALRRAGDHCQLCGKNNGLNVHHNSYDRLGHERKSDVVALCVECHRIFHGILPKPDTVIPPICDIEGLERILHINT